MYTQKDIESLFNELKNNSYSDLCLSSKIFFKDMKIIGISSPFSGNVYINLSLLNKQNWSRKAIIGILAHEISHQVSYRKRSFLKKWSFLWNYYLSIKKRKEVEKEADMIAMRRGYGKEIFEERKLQEKYFLNNKEKLGLLNKFYLSSKEVKKLLYVFPNSKLTPALSEGTSSVVE
ncbi:hypothetical protein J4207_05335 [Candidatus Woesearchaeota archaeon]|nr:hypothetical protein [Candidatus Woesearchaeota archaeon]